MKTKRMVRHIAILAFTLTSTHSIGAEPTIEVRMIPRVLVSAEPGSTITIEYAADLPAQTNWVTWTNILMTTPTIALSESAVEYVGKRFYRAKKISIPEDPNPSNPDPNNLVWAPAGSFVMGSSNNDLGRESDEGPLTTVIIGHGFWVRRTETTQLQYRSVMGTNPSRHKGDGLPVHDVGWGEAAEYCATFTDLERQAGRLPLGFEYRLPTEAEWEYACRAGTTTRYHWGEDPTQSQVGRYAWFRDNSDRLPHPPAAKLPNPWGIYDMTGNVLEWCLDYYSNALSGDSAIDPIVLVQSSFRIWRGGDASADPALLRSPWRGGGVPNYPTATSIWEDPSAKVFVGFRMVLARPIQ
ncbi:MAG: formylglycine-generating enzyme family protein [Verrucomicrobiales bacterium]|nr:formylglycine-generating enzyme family protein [Verrucomicrobiales bacterium]